MKSQYLRLFTWVWALVVGLALFFVTLWFAVGRHYHEVVPLSFTRSGIPYGRVSIENTTCQLKFDLGSRLELSLFEDVLAPMEKIPKGVETFKNFRGTSFSRNCFVLPKVSIDSLSFNRPHAISRPRDDYKDYIVQPSIGSKAQKNGANLVVGSLGRGLLKKVNSLWDIQNSQVLFSDDMKKLKRSGYDIKSFTKVPFILDPKGIILEITTDLGRGKFILDSGATRSFIQAKLVIGSDRQASAYAVYRTHKFAIGEEAFDPVDFHPIEMTPELDGFAGYLGIDFFYGHIMYIDFSHHCLYVKK